jgi:hypothetical protein
MKQLLVFLILLPLALIPMETPTPVTVNSQKSLSAHKLIELNAQQQKLLNIPLPQTISKTPALDTYKCAYILGTLKPEGIAKLKRKIPEQLCPLVAQKKHQGKPTSLSEEIELWKWQSYLAQKYSRPAVTKENKV